MVRWLGGNLTALKGLYNAFWKLNNLIASVKAHKVLRGKLQNFASLTVKKKTTNYEFRNLFLQNMPYNTFYCSCFLLQCTNYFRKTFRSGFKAYCICKYWR